MRMLAYLLAIICIVVAVVYFVMPAGSLPTFMPGYVAGSDHIHHTHALAALVAAIILFIIGWRFGRAAS
jgi:membrane protein DedA with SNARE-associated domain